MTIEQIDSRLQLILTHLGISPTAIADQASFTRDLGLDSLDVTDLLIQVESSFGILIPDEDWWKLETVGQLKAYLVNETKYDADQSVRIEAA